jgi:hypothetical protein
MSRKPGAPRIRQKTASMNMSLLDWTIVVVYLLGVVGLGCWTGINEADPEIRARG